MQNNSKESKNMPNCVKDYQVIFSLRVRLALREKGIEPALEMINKKYPNLKCWKYVADSAFQDALEEIRREE